MAISLTRPEPLDKAVAQLSAKTPVGSRMRTWEWSRFPAEIRNAAMFSAAVMSARVLGGMQERLVRAAKLERTRLPDGTEGAFMDRQKFVKELRALAMAEGLFPQDGSQGTLKDVTSVPRLNLVFDTNMGLAQGYAQRKIDLDKDVLDAFPAQELVRVEGRKMPRDWRGRWAEAGGEFAGGRMAALKTDPVWEKISRFGNPWPPFDFNSGMGLRDIPREEAESLGLIAPGAEVSPPKGEGRFDANLQADTKGMGEELVSELKRGFGDQITVGAGMIRWNGDAIPELYRKATSGDGGDEKLSVNLGEASAKARALAREHMDIEGFDFLLTEDAVVHAQKRHGQGAEKRRDQRPVRQKDFERLPDVWRNPDEVRAGEKPRSLVFSKRFFDREIAVLYQRDPNQRRFTLSTLYVKTGGEAS